jgi:hypothetical protein
LQSSGSNFKSGVLRHTNLSTPDLKLLPDDCKGYVPIHKAEITDEMYFTKMMYDFSKNSDSMKAANGTIFISHSSKDKEVMEKFTDYILQLGIGLSHEDIFCTSIEEMGIRNGEDIRQHIKDNVQGADFSFLMLSKNYKKSEICLNEMGAVWAVDNRVWYYLLPNVDFKEIGWLCETNKAEKLYDSVVLDALEEELTDFYGLPHKGGIWSRQRQNFVEYLTNNANNA